jgi:hypothetical protein
MSGDPMRRLALCSALCTLLLGTLPGETSAQTIRTVAGTGTAGYSGDGGAAADAAFNSPVGVHGNGSGQIWIADTGNHRVRRVTALFDSVVTYAGTGSANYTGDGAAATAATLNAPTDVFVDSTGNVYIADTGNHVVRRVAPSGTITTVAGTGTAGFVDDTTATAARLNSPSGVYVTNGGIIYIADRGNHRIRRVDASGAITTFAGTGANSYSGDGGPARSAALSSPSDVYLDRAGVLYVVDSNNHRIRAIAADSTITTVAGTGSAGFSGDGGLATNARLAFPRSVYVDTAGSIYIADRFNHRLRRVNTSGNITTLAGDGTLDATGDGAAANLARLGSPGGVWLHDDREIFIGDGGNHRVRWIDDDQVLGLSGTTTFGPGREVGLVRAAFTGDGTAAVKGVRLTVSDLSAATGIDTSDFEAFRLYESPDSLFSASDTLLGTVPAGDVTLGTTFTVQAASSPVPADGQRRHYIVTALLAEDAVEGRSFKVGVPAGGLSTTIGGQGVQERAADSDRVTIDVIATRLLFATQPDGAISSNPLLTQPVVHAVDDLGYVDSDFTDTVTLTVSGGSGSLLQATAAAAAGKANFSSVTYVAAADQESFALVADDEASGAEGDLPATTSNTLVANSQNDAPTVVALSFTIDEDDSVTVPLSSMVADVDDSLSALILTFAASHTQATVSGTNLTIRPEANFAGRDTLRITAEDPFGATASDEAVLTIRAINDRPVLAPLGRRTLAEDDTLTVDLSTLASDVETPFAGLRWSFLPSSGLSASFDSGTGLLRAWAAPDASGTYTLRSTVLDPEGLAATVTDTIVVTPVNDPPAIAFPAGVTISRDSTWTLDLRPRTSDPEHAVSTVTYAIDGSSGLTATLAGSQLTVSAAAGFSGAGTVDVRATDPLNAAATHRLEVQVVSDMPQAPILSALPAQSVELGATLQLPLGGFVSDPDHADDLLSWTVSAPPRGTATVIDGVLRLTTQGTTHYSATLTLTVTDPDGLQASGPLEVTVTQPLPLLTGVPASLEIDLDGEERLLDTFLKSGIDPQHVVWSALSEGDLDVVIDPATRVLTITPSGESRAGGRVQLTATSLTQSATDTIDVTVANVLPTLNLPDLFVDAGESAQLLLDDFATDDEDVSRLTWSATPLLPGLTASINQAVRALTLTAAEGISGDIAIALRAVDAQGGIGLDTMTVSVREPGLSPGDSSLVDTAGTNEAPVIAALSLLSFLAGNEGRLDLDAVVTDDRAVTELRWSAEPGAGVAATLSATRRLTVTGLQDFTGRTSVRLTATDIYGARDTATLVVEVRSPVGSPSPGDFDGSGRVDLDDFFAFVDHLGTSVFTPGFDARYDLDGDGRVTFDDFFRFIDLFEAQRALP